MFNTDPHQLSGNTIHCDFYSLRRHKSTLVLTGTSIPLYEYETAKALCATVISLKKNPNIFKYCLFDFQVRLRDIFETETHLYIVQELVSGGELCERCASWHVHLGIDLSEHCEIFLVAPEWTVMVGRKLLQNKVQVSRIHLAFFQLLTTSSVRM